MIKNIYKVSQVMAFLPFMAMPASTLNFNSVLVSSSLTSESNVAVSLEEIREARANAIDAYYKKRDMPLEGKGMQFVLVAEKYGLDWRLLPSIAVRESSGGKNDCGHNPFGWGSCKLHNFKSYDEAIEVLGKNLGGANARTAKYYAGKTNEEKLYYYNGSVEPPYIGEVLAIMNTMGKGIE